MKNLMSGVMHDQLGKTKASSVPVSLSTQPILYLLVLVSTFLFNAYKKYDANEVKSEDEVGSSMGTNTSPDFSDNKVSVMKRLIGFIRRIFIKRRSRSSSFDEAIAEGFSSTLKEMGY